MLRFKTYLSEQLSPEELGAAAAARARSRTIPDISYVERSSFPQQTGSRLGFVPGEGNRPGRIRAVGGSAPGGGRRPATDFGTSVDPNSSNPANLGRQVSAGLLDTSNFSRSPVLPALGREVRTPATFSTPQPQMGMGTLGARAVNRDAARERLASIQQTRGAGILDTVVSGIGREMLRQDLRAGRKGASARGMNIIGNISNAFLPAQQLSQGIGAVAGRLGRITQRITNLGRPMGIGVNNPQSAQDEAQRQQVLQGAAQNQLAALRQNPNYQAFQSGQQLAKDAADRAQNVANRRQQIKQGEESLESPEQTRFRMANNATFSATTSPTTRRYGMQDLGLDQTDFYPNISPQEREQIAAAARQRMAASAPDRAAAIRQRMAAKNTTTGPGIDPRELD